MSIGISRFIPTDYSGPMQNYVPIRFFPREPTSTDKKYRIGQMAIVAKDPSSGSYGDLWYLARFESNGDATWLQLGVGGGLGDVDSLTTDDGAPAVIPDGNGNINILGGTSIVTSGQGPGDDVTISLDSDVATQYDTDSGSAVPAANVLEVLGGSGIDTSGATNVITITAAADVPTTFTCDTGSATPAANNLNVLGSGAVSTSGATDTITISVTGVIISCVEVTVGGPTAMSVDTCYIANTSSPTLCELTLPTTAAQGSIIEILGKGTGGFQINQNAGQSIRFVEAITTTGATGKINSTKDYETLVLRCITANSGWQVLNGTGNLIFT